MTPLKTNANISNPDEFYAELISAFDHLADDECEAMKARLILILANHIGDRDVLSAALKAARKTS